MSSLSWIGADMLSADIKAIDGYCRRGFDYTSDVGDVWRSHLLDVLAGRRWMGDCDDLASTTLDALGRRGARLSSRWRLMVSSAGSGYALVNHMIGCVQADDGTFWIVGDTFGPAYPSTRIRHAARYYQRLDFATSGKWQSGYPFR